MLERSIRHAWKAWNANRETTSTVGNCQHQLAARLSTFQIAMRGRDVGQRIRAGDSIFQSTAPHGLEDIARPPEELFARQQIVGEIRPREEQGALRVENSGIDRGDRSARLPEQRERAPRSQAVQTLVERRLAD